MSDRTKVFVDVGTHVGRYSIRFAKKGAVVHAFEPNPTNREILEKNCELNNLRINIHACALGSEKTEATITMDADKSRIGVGTVTVPVNALDSYHIDNIDLIKI